MDLPFSSRACAIHDVVGFFVQRDIEPVSAKHQCNDAPLNATSQDSDALGKLHLAEQGTLQRLGTATTFLQQDLHLL